MKIYKEENLSGFEFWSGAKVNAEQLTVEELEELTGILEEVNPDGMSETEINDLIWFDFETVCEWLNLEYDSAKGEIIR